MKNINKNIFIITFGKVLNITLFILLIIDVIFIILDFNEFTYSSGVGHHPTKRVGIITGFLIFLHGIQYICCYFFGDQHIFVYKIFKWIKKSDSKIYLLTGIIGIFLGLGAIILGFLGWYN